MRKMMIPKSNHIQGWKSRFGKGLGKIAISPDHSISNVFLVDSLDYNLLSISQLCEMVTTVFLLILVSYVWLISMIIMLN
jgi:hypothetical protein